MNSHLPATLEVFIAPMARGAKRLARRKAFMVKSILLGFPFEEKCDDVAKIFLIGAEVGSNESTFGAYENCSIVDNHQPSKFLYVES